MGTYSALVLTSCVGLLCALLRSGPRSALGHFAVAAKHQKLADVSDAELLNAFNAFDTLKDGTIARKQLRALLDHLYGHPPPESTCVVSSPVCLAQL